MATQIFPAESALVVMSHTKLGDFLLLTPHLRRIQHHYSDVTVAVPDLLMELYREKQVLPHFVAMSEVAGQIADPARKPYKHIVNLTYPLLKEAEELPPHHLRLNAGCFLKPRHVFQSYGEALHEIFPHYTDIPEEPSAFLSDAVCAATMRRYDLKPYMYFTVHAGSDFAPKNWDSANFEDSVRILLDRHQHLTCVSLVGPQDEELFRGAPPPERFVSLRLPLRETAAVLASSLFHIDNDSGVNHLAGALDVPSISVFGPTAPGTWASMAQMNFVHWGGPNCAEHCEGARMRECADRVCLNSVRPADLAFSADRILRNYAHFC